MYIYIYIYIRIYIYISIFTYIHNIYVYRYIYIYVVRALSQHPPERIDSTGVAMYCGGVEGTDAFSLGKESPVYIGLF